MDAAPGVTDRPCRIPRELSDTAYFTERALTYLKGKGRKPWFLHLGYYRPHPPFIAPAPYHAMYSAADMPAPLRRDTWQEEAAQHPLLAHYLSAIGQASFFRGGEGAAHRLDEAAIRQMRATYCGLITEIDDALGQVFAHLRETGQWEETMVIFTSDHGEQLGDHWLLGKIGYHDESFRIPLVIKPAGGTRRAGEVEDAFTESVDVMPTILAALGGEIPRATDGRDLAPLVATGAPSAWRRFAFTEYDFRDVFYSRPETALGLAMDDCALCAIQDGAWKYVHFSGLPPLLFDLAADPHMFRNLAEDPAHAPRALDMAQAMLSHRMRHAERALTHFRATPAGLEERLGAPEPSLPAAAQ